jgi:hypothetical protein
MSNEQAKVAPEAYSLRWGSAAFRLRCVDCKRVKSSKGNDMLNQTFEIFGADPVKNQESGEMVDINGLQVYTRQMLMEKSLKYINIQRNSLGLPPVGEGEVLSIEGADYLRTEGAAIVVANLEEKKNEVTGEVVVNPLTGKPATRVTREITEWFSRE